MHGGVNPASIWCLSGVSKSVLIAGTIPRKSYPGNRDPGAGGKFLTPLWEFLQGRFKDLILPFFPLFFVFHDLIEYTLLLLRIRR
jgi:hypothetical protein